MKKKSSKQKPKILTVDEIADINKKLAQDALDEINKQVKAYFNSPSNFIVASKPGRINIGMSPTDIDAKGVYPYQEPEVDEQGTYYGYKVLKVIIRDYKRIEIISPRYPTTWKNGELTSDLVPDERSMHGIHFTKRPDHSELGNYLDRYGKNYSSYWENCNYILVKCALFGDVVIETSQGMRSHKAKIISLFIDNHWITYEDYCKGNK